MRDFDYHLAADVKSAIETLRNSEDGKIVAGGMTLLPTLKQRLAAPSDLIDLGGIDALRGISIEDNHVVIRAMTIHADVGASDVVKKAIPALAVLAGGIGDPAVRHRGTIGGSIANSDPAADYPGGVMGLGATIVTDRREIAGDDFFLGLFETALEPDELITSVRFPIPDQAHYIKFKHPASGYAVVGVMVSKTGGKVRVGVTGAGPCAFRVTAFETALEKSFSPDAIADITVDAEDLNTDINFSAEYRAHIVGVLARRCVAALTKG